MGRLELQTAPVSPLHALDGGINVKRQNSVDLLELSALYPRVLSWFKT